MARHDNVGIKLREASRQELKNDVERFLAQGGKIEQISNPVCSEKKAAKTWRPSYAQSFESGF